MILKKLEKKWKLRNNGKKLHKLLLIRLIKLILVLIMQRIAVRTAFFAQVIQIIQIRLILGLKTFCEKQIETDKQGEPLK